MPSLVIYVECTDESDIDWVRGKLVPMVENAVEDPDMDIVDRLDGEVEVSWEVEDDE